MKILQIELSDRAWLGLEICMVKHGTAADTMLELLLLGELLASPDLSEEEA